jgi:hypothetical protein
MKAVIPNFQHHLNSLPEIELLLCCARTSIDAATAERMQVLIAAGIDWDLLLQHAGRQGVLSLLHKSLSCSEIVSVPEVALERLTAYARSLAVKNLFLTRELLRIIELLREQGILAIPFKGPVLARMAYGDLTLREFCDLDILVDRQHFFEAKRLLLAQGYEPAREPWFLTEAQEAAFIRDQGEYSLVSRDRRVWIDLHQRLIAGDLFVLTGDFESFGDRLQFLEISGQTVLTFQPEDLLLYLCIHGAKSLWERLGWVCDVAELIRAYPKLNWQRVLEDAKFLGIERMLFLGLLLASDHLSATLPVEVAQKIQSDLTCQSLAMQVWQRLTGETKCLTKEFNVEKFVFHWRAMKRFQDRLHYVFKCFLRYSLVLIWRVLRPSLKDQRFLLLPRSLYFLYFLIRPFRIADGYRKAIQETNQ